MRRAVSTALMLLFTLSLFAPLLAASAGPELPPCCRRGGAHHCAMPMAVQSSSDGPAAGAKCPFYPHQNWAPAAFSALLIAHPARAHALPARINAPALQRVAPRRLLIDVAEQRGPPSVPIAR